MKKYSSAFSRASAKISHAATRTCSDYAVGNLPDEPTFTGALVSRIQDALYGFQTNGIFWSGRVLTSHGSNAEETEFGADFLGILNLSLPGLSIRKGFLAQSKRQEPGSRLNSSDWSRLVVQCEKMLSFTPESFVFVYSLNGVFMIPAIKVISCHEREDLHTLHPEKTGSFYRRHFECFIGDSRINEPYGDPLTNLKFSSGIEISAMSDNTE